MNNQNISILIFLYILFYNACFFNLEISTIKTEYKSVKKFRCFI